MGAIQGNDSSLRIPVIDISKASAAGTADQLVDAIAQYGFVFVRGKGIGFTRQIIDDAFALVRSRSFLSRQTILTLWIVTKLLLVKHRRERKMCYPSQRESPSVGIFSVHEPVSHIQLEYRLVVNALRNIRPKDPEGNSSLPLRYFAKSSKRGDFKESSPKSGRPVP